MTRCFFAVTLAFATASAATSAPLTQAHVTKIINDVQVVDPAAGSRAAHIDDLIKDEVGLKTGVKSRSELLFEDNTLTRVGPETYFSFKAGTRDMSLQQGTMLLQVPKGLGGAKIRTAAVTASITGTTIMMEYMPKQHIKVLVLEGSLRLSRNGTFGDDLLLTPGKMVIMKPDAKRIPDPVNVDLAKLVKTSSLVTMSANRKGDAATLPSMALIQAEIDKQATARNDGTIIDTNLVIHGRGTDVAIEPDRTLSAVERQTPVLAKNEPPAAGNSGSVPAAPSTQPSPADNLGPSSSPQPTSSSSSAGASPTPDPASSPAASATPADDERNVQYGTKDGRVGDLSVTEPIDLSTDGGHGKVTIASTGTVAVSSTIKVSGTDSKTAGKISIDTTKKNGTAINITSSAQLLALLNAAAPAKNGLIQFASAGGDVNVSGKLQADGGTIDIENNGTNGVVNLKGATLNASTVKVGAVGKNGALNVGGGTISADTAIKLYAGGTNGTVNFVDNVTLSGNSAKTIAADAVTIFNGKVVTVQGNAPASVFTNHANYSGFGGNGSTTGTFAGQGATTQPLSSLPPGP